MKKNILPLTILVILVIVAVYVYNTKGKGSGVSEKGLKDFAIEDTGSVNKIFIAKDTNTVKLKRKENGRWMLNDKYRANENQVDLLLGTLKDIELKAPVPKSAKNTVLKDMAAKNTIVEIYKEGEEKWVKKYHLGTPTQNHLGTYMLLETKEEGKSKLPFITYIRKEKGYLTPRFFTKMKRWRYTGVFDFNIKDIRRIQVDFKRKPENSFYITIDNENNTKLFSQQNGEINNFDSVEVKNYILNYKDVHVETYNHGLSPDQVDSVVNSKPVHEIFVKDNKGNVESVVTYYKPNEKGFKKPDGSKAEHDLERMYAMVNDKNFAVIQKYIFDRLLQPVRIFKKNNSKSYSSLN